MRSPASRSRPVSSRATRRPWSPSRAGELGLVLAGPPGRSGPRSCCSGVVVLAIGYAYDLRFKGTAWSWLPFAVGIPLLPVYGWVGATGGVPASFAVLVPAAVVAGAGLAVANARADESARPRERHRRRWRPDSAAVWSWRVDAVLLSVVVGAAIVTLLAGGAGAVPLVGRGRRPRSSWRPDSSIGRSDDAGRRERAWETPGDRRRGARRGVAGGRAARGLGEAPDRSAPLSSRSRRSGPARSRSRGGASRSSGTWRGSPDRSPRSSRGPRRSPGPRPARRPRRRGSAWR